MRLENLNQRHLPDSLAAVVSGFPGRYCFGYWLMRVSDEMMKKSLKEKKSA